MNLLSALLITLPLFLWLSGDDSECIFTVLFSVYFCGADEVGAGAARSSGQQVVRSTVMAVSVICFGLCYQAVWLLITDFEVYVEDLMSCSHK